MLTQRTAWPLTPAQSGVVERSSWQTRHIIVNTTPVSLQYIWVRAQPQVNGVQLWIWCCGLGDAVVCGTVSSSSWRWTTAQDQPGNCYKIKNMSNADPRLIAEWSCWRRLSIKDIGRSRNGSIAKNGIKMMILMIAAVFRISSPYGKTAVCKKKRQMNAWGWRIRFLAWYFIPMWSRAKT